MKKNIVLLLLVCLASGSFAKKALCAEEGINVQLRNAIGSSEGVEKFLENYQQNPPNDDLRKFNDNQWKTKFRNDLHHQSLRWNKTDITSPQAALFTYGEKKADSRWLKYAGLTAGLGIMGAIAAKELKRPPLHVAAIGACIGFGISGIWHTSHTKHLGNLARDLGLLGSNKFTIAFPEGSTGCNFLYGLTDDLKAKAQSILADLNIENGNAYEPECLFHEIESIKENEDGLILHSKGFVTKEGTKEFKSQFGPYYQDEFEVEFSPVKTIQEIINWQGDPISHRPKKDNTTYNVYDEVPQNTSYQVQYISVQTFWDSNKKILRYVVKEIHNPEANNSVRSKSTLVKNDEE